MIQEQPAFQAAGLVKKFGSRTAVDRLTFDVARGEIFGIVGPDDAGKTTLLRMLAGILQPTEGSVDTLGMNASGDKSLILQNIGYVAQVFSLYQDLTVRENLEFFGKVFSIPTDVYAVRVKELLIFSNLERFQDRLAGNLSGGMKKKLSVISSLVHKPKILVMDEPTIGVDPVTRRELWRMFYSLRQEGITIVVSTSYMDEAELCSRIAYMYQGQFIMLDSPQNIKRLFSPVIWKVGGKPRDSVKAALRGMGAGTAWAPFGLEFHLYDESQSLNDNKITEYLAQWGCSDLSIKMIPVSIEDVFVKKLQEMEL